MCLSGDGGQLGDRLIFKEVRRPKLQSGACGARQDQRAQDRIAAKVNEVVVDADGFHLQHLSPNVDERFFGRRARGGEIRSFEIGGKLTGKRALQNRGVAQLPATILMA